MRRRPTRPEEYSPFPPSSVHKLTRSPSSPLGCGRLLTGWNNVSPSRTGRSHVLVASTHSGVEQRSGDGCCHNSGNGIFIYSALESLVSYAVVASSPVSRPSPCSLSVTVIAQPTDSAGARILAPPRPPRLRPGRAAALNSWAEKRTEKNYDIVYLIEPGWSGEPRRDSGDGFLKFTFPKLNDNESWPRLFLEIGPVLMRQLPRNDSLMQRHDQPISLFPVQCLSRLP